MGQFQRKPILVTNKNTTQNEIVRFEVLTSALMKALVFWDVKVKQSRYRPGVVQRVPGS
jgi:hypothetical protein